MSSNRVPRRSPLSYRSCASALAHSRRPGGGVRGGESCRGGGGGACLAGNDAFSVKDATNESSTMFSCQATNVTFCRFAQSLVFTNRRIRHVFRVRAVTG